MCSSSKHSDYSINKWGSSNKGGKSKQTLITTCTHNYGFQLIQPLTFKMRGEQVLTQQKEMNVFFPCSLFVRGTRCYDTHTQNVPGTRHPERGRRINHFARVLTMHARKGGCMSGTLNHQKLSMYSFFFLFLPKRLRMGKVIFNTVCSGEYFVATRDCKPVVQVLDLVSLVVLQSSRLLPTKAGLWRITWVHCFSS